MNEYSRAAFLHTPRRHHAIVFCYRGCHSHRIQFYQCPLELCTGVVLKHRLNSQRCSLAFALYLVCGQLGFPFDARCLEPPNRNHSCQAMWETWLKEGQRKCPKKLALEVCLESHER